MSKSLIQTPENQAPVFTIEQAFEIRRQVNAGRPSHQKVKRWDAEMQERAKHDISQKLNALKAAKNWEALRVMAYTASRTTVLMGGCAVSRLLPDDYERVLINAAKWSLEPARPFNMKRSKTLTLTYSVKLDKVYINRNRKYTIRQFMPTLKDYRIQELAAAKEGRPVRMFGLEHNGEYSIQQLERYLPYWLFETVTTQIAPTGFYPTLKSDVAPLTDWGDFTLVRVSETKSKWVEIG
tara:strand:+ start:654 stop:1367 length:714 start_codon:yes stop_codon:yes gene_type:complete